MSFKLFFTIGLAIGLLQGCGRSLTDDGKTGCGEPDKRYYMLKEEEKAKLKYSGNEMLVFVGPGPDTVYCRGSGKKPFYKVKYEYGSQDCPPNELYWESNNYLFKDSAKGFSIEINQIYDEWEIVVNGLSIFPINTLYFYEKYYSDSVKTNKKVYPTVPIDNKSGTIIQYNMARGVVAIEHPTGKWILCE
jgi:hypothetical protein